MRDSEPKYWFPMKRYGWGWVALFVAIHVWKGEKP